jgi:ankyrin repeat protein
LVAARVARHEELLLPAPRVQLYEGDTALHAAAFSYDVEIAQTLAALGADVRARNRRGAEPLHAAVLGGPGAPRWNPAQQRSMILCLVDLGADPNATAKGGATALHRAVRNRCSAAVDALLSAGADPRALNDRGSSPTDLSQHTTGRGGVGTSAAKAEQRIIVDLLKQATS